MRAEVSNLRMWENWTTSEFWRPRGSLEEKG